jgi:hypothetical protein
MQLKVHTDCLREFYAYILAGKPLSRAYHWKEYKLYYMLRSSSCDAHRTAIETNLKRIPFCRAGHGQN